MNKKKKQVHATQSFTQMMSQAQLNALKPFIQQEVNNTAYGLYRSLLKAMSESQAAVQTRLMALERLLIASGNLNESAIGITVATIEDEVLGYTAVTDAAQPGDKLRLQVKSRAKGTDTWNEDRLVINSLGTTNKDGAVQTLTELETALVLTTTNQTVTVTIPAEQEGGVEAELLATVVMISRKKAQGV